MATFAALLLVLVVAIPSLLIGLVLWWVRRSRSDDGGAPAQAARRHEFLISGSAFGAAVLAAVALITQPVSWPGWAPAPGVLQALTPFAVASVFGTVRAVGELTWPRPRGEVRAAPLTRRTPWTVGGARLRWLLTIAVTLVLVLVATGITADPTGRAVASPAVTLPNGDTIGASAGPFPGWAYGAPMLIGLAGTLAVTAVALAVITRRAPLHGLPAAHDDAVRRTSAGRLLAVVQLCLGVALGGVLVVAGSRVESLGQNISLNGGDPGASILLGRTVAVVGLLVLLGAIIAATAALWPRRVPRAEFSAPTSAPSSAHAPR